MLSVIIPSRSPQYLQKTIDDILAKAKDPLEIIVVLDGIWPDPMVKDDPRVRIIHHGTIHDSPGMRAGINKGVAIAQGEYIMKIDEHCMVSEGFDQVMSAGCEDDMIIIPRRKRLDAESWSIVSDGRVDVDLMHVEYPYLKPLDKTQGLHGAIWKRPERADILHDETPTMQGSCYFIKKSYWEKLLPEGMDDQNYGPFTQEAQELSMTAWLSGGRGMVFKDVFYAHMHKGSAGKAYGFSNSQYKKHCEMNERGRLFCINKWLYTKEYKYDFEWFVDKKFPGMPNWPVNWKERILVDRENDYSTLGYKNDEWLSNLRKP